MWNGELDAVQVGTRPRMGIPALLGQDHGQLGMDTWAGPREEPRREVEEFVGGWLDDDHIRRRDVVRIGVLLHGLLRSVWVSDDRHYDEVDRAGGQTAACAVQCDESVYA